ncbi:hypothetical protein D3C78_1636940 [compost metagenome]
MRSEVVHLGGFGVLQQTNAGRQISQIVFDQMQVRVGLDAQLLDTPEIDRTGTTVGAVDGVPLLQQQFRQVGAVLASDASYDCFHVNLLNSICWPHRPLISKRPAQR